MLFAFAVIVSVLWLTYRPYQAIAVPARQPGGKGSVVAVAVHREMPDSGPSRTRSTSAGVTAATSPGMARFSAAVAAP